ncbi:AAEL011726-PA [Aedes aegypti]|uniref:AAEL011726-PA n=1 Tax=Aedes aegypti TaxID=7159 RepID=Q16P93_AEDAE|nr:AAEL011726-PA [Aedes aegypti]
MDELLELDETADYSIVEQLMQTTFQYREGLRNRNTSCTEILNQFPYFLYYDGKLIHNEFEAMFPDKQASQQFSTVVPLCLMLNHFYNEIACVGIQALLKIMAELTHQGNVRKSEPSNLPPLEDYASVFVKWRQESPNEEMEVSEVPFVYCDALPFAEGTYFVVMEKGAIDCGEDFFLALDLLLKAYKVLNINIPSKAKKTIDFFNVFVYKIIKRSRVTRVNDLCAHLSKAANALP